MPVGARPYPVVLLLEGRKVLVVGGGTVAASKVAGLVAAGAEVHVVALAVADEVKAQPVTWEERPYAVGEAGGYRFVVTATDDPEVNAQVFRDGEAAGVNSILNFAPTLLQVPRGVRVRKVDLAVELQILSFYQQRRAGGPPVALAD